MRFAKGRHRDGLEGGRALANSLRKVAVATLSLGLVFSLALTGCAPKTDSEGGGDSTEVTKGGTLSYYIGEPAYIDPFNMQESEGTQVGQALFDSLTAFDPLDPTNIVPAAADSWEPNADASVWTFKLNKDAKFSDGTPVMAKDFIYAWNRIANPATKNTSTGEADPSVISYHLANVKGYDEVSAGTATEMSGLKAVDDYTLEVTLKESFADFEFVVGHPALAPVPQKSVEEGVDYNGEMVPFGDFPVGNGPFKMSEPWKRGQYIKVVQNENYYGTAANIDGVDFRIFKDPNTAFTEFEAGTLDFCQIGEGKIKDSVTKYGESPNGYTVNPGEQALLGEETAVYYLVANTKNDVMKDANMRKAVSFAINRQAIADIVYEGTRGPADNIVPPGVAGYEQGVWENAKYDVEAAKKALAEAGYPEGAGAPELTLTFNNDGGHEKVMELIQSDLKAIGITVKFDAADFPTTLKKYDAGNFQIGRLGWIADYPIMDNFLYPLFYTGSGDNKSAYSDPAFDKLVDEARATVDSAERIAKYQEADTMVGESLPVIPIVFYRHHHIGSDRVNELTYSAMGLADFQTVWLKAAE